ncbi:MAG TPA: glycine--tRNA ligase subunit beta [Thermoanaerobaculia bacterium]|nr:glycine--tRNA ligase subunit beta [Thermoanaerobaculia bacterium]
MNRHDFLLEVRTEEIPAPVVVTARRDLARLVGEGLAGEGLAAASVESYGTPRRLIVILRGLPEKQEDRYSEVLGPPASTAYDAEGHPTKAARGFARAQEVQVSELVVVDSTRGPTVAVRRTISGKQTADVLAAVVPRAISAMTFPKTMRWGDGSRTYVRPVRSVVAVFGGHVVAMEILGVAAGSRTVGHPALSELPIRVSGPDDYLQKLRTACVEPDGEARRIRILEGARELAAAVGGSIESDLDLATTLADLVEWPGVVRGSFAPEFLELPEEVTTTAMRTHQKYLPVRGPAGLLPHFIAVMDNTEDRRGLIAKGNEWVLNARLADARFFYEEDRRQTLESRLPELSRLSFQDRLGDYRQKTERVERLAEAIAPLVGRPDLVDSVKTAARLSKVDLTTRMVREFTDLQGIVGGIYARLQGHPESVWRSIYDHYRPAGGTGEPPREAPGAILALADRFDTLAGLFRLGLVPTGSRDPYGLRRAAFGIVGIAIGRTWRVDWKPIARQALSQYPEDLTGLAVEEALGELEKFFAERLRALLERRGHSYDEISAVMGAGLWDFADVADRASALSEARRKMDFRSLVLAAKRIRNILGDEEAVSPENALYREEAERQLASDFLQAQQLVGELASARRYRAAMETLASIAPSLDRFFVEVLVNCPEPDLRRNRLALLGAIQKELSKLADFSEIVVEK